MKRKSRFLAIYGLSFFVLGGVGCAIFIDVFFKSSSPMTTEEFLRCDVPDDSPDSNAVAVIEQHSPFWHYNPAAIQEVFQHFSGLTLAKKFNISARLSGMNHVPDEAIAVLQREIMNKQYPEMYRNNIAEVLLRQANKHDMYASMFYSMYLDKSETEKWRSYAIQFYAKCAALEPGAELIRQNLLSILETDNKTFTVTTINMILNEKAALGLSDENIRRVIVMLGARSKSHPENMTAMVTGANSLCSQEILALVREALARTADADVRVVSLGVLGKYGEKDDIELVKRFLFSEEKGVQTTSTWALAMLTKKYLLNHNGGM